jgi:polysaccharide deacetylase family protein (PEP-CTERM system associated)
VTAPVGEPLNAFCVDLEEWFHVCGVETPYSDPESWKDAPSLVVGDTEVLLRLLDEAGARGTFVAVGWIAERYPELIERIAAAGHEIGCHGYYHRLVYELEPEEFRADLGRALELLRDLSGQPVRTFRAPGFSMKRDCFWAYPILRELGIEIDISIVPASRDHGGVPGFTRDPFLLHTEAGDLKVFPVSVVRLLGRTVPFSGGGYLRLLPLSLIRYGFRQNHREGRPGMSYIHPREHNPDQPRLPLPLLKYFKYYVGIRGTEEKLRRILARYRFGTVAEVIDGLERFPEYRLRGRDIVPA